MSIERLVGDRTPFTNQIWSLLLERGHIVAQGHAVDFHLELTRVGA